MCSLFEFFFATGTDVNKRYIAYFSLRMRETAAFVLRV